MIGIVGSGNIGPDIALYMSKVGRRVVVNDIAQAALDNGRARTEKKIARGVETGAFKPAQAEAMLDKLTWTTDKSALAGAEMIIEAATEELRIKQAIFRELDAPILASNSSHLEPEAIFGDDPRGLVTHFFFPAERNPVVEVVPGRATDPSVADFCMKFFEAIGKVPIRVGSRYGYALDPIFEGLFLAALRLADAGTATHKQIDVVAQQALGLGVGPFTAMNLTGGTPITRIGLGHYKTKIMSWFDVPPGLRDRAEPWPAPGRGENVAVDAVYDAVASRLTGAYFGLVGEVLDSGITNVDDLNMAAELALVIRPPFEMMNAVGPAESRRLVEAYAAEQPGFRVAESLRRTTPWPIRTVLRRDEGDVAVVTIRRPKTLNALDRGVYAELRSTFEAIGADPKIRAAVLTGFGVKAFVSGADIGMLAAVKTPDEGAALSWESHEALLAIERCGKPVVAALNGLALGGGSELALACTARIAKPGLPICFGQPEPKLGIIPGSGATQRLPRLIGFEAAWEILRTGRNVGADETLRLGYVAELADDVVARAIDLARTLRPARPRALQIPATPPAVGIGALSRRVDAILCKAVLEGCRMPLEAGLRFESACFGEVCGTRDFRIGLENFLATRLREPASFVHA